MKASSECPVIAALTARCEEHSQGDPMVHAITQKMRTRSAIGTAKYGHTLARKDITEEGWIKHAQEEALDLAAYLEAIRHHHGEVSALTEMQEQALAMATILEASLSTAEDEDADEDADE